MTEHQIKDQGFVVFALTCSVLIAELGQHYLYVLNNTLESSIGLVYNMPIPAVSCEHSAGLVVGFYFIADIVSNFLKQKMW